MRWLWRLSLSSARLAWCVIESLDNVFSLVELLSNVFMLSLRLTGVTECHQEYLSNSQEIILTSFITWKCLIFYFPGRRQCARTSCEGLNSSQNECNKTKFTSNWSLSNWSTNVRSLWWIYFQKQIYLNTHFISTEWSQAKINLIFTWFCMHHV